MLSRMTHLVNQTDVVWKQRMLLLSPVHLVAHMPIVRAVHVVAAVLPNLAVVSAEPAVALVYATKGILAAAPKEAHAPRIRENRLTPNFYILGWVNQSKM